jgi:transcription antitermination factor NusG
MKRTWRGSFLLGSNLRVDQEVSINGGPFDGLTGIIEEPPNAKGRVRVLLETS